MIASWRLIFVVPFVCSAVAAEKASYEVRGRLVPPFWYARVELNSLDKPMLLSTLSVGGQFKFRKLEPGVYVLSTATRRGYTASRTVEIGPKTADRKGRIEVILRLRASKGALTAQSKVSYRVISLPKNAVKEYFRAQDALRGSKQAEATAHLLRATELAPKFAEAWAMLGSIAAQSRQYTDAEKYLRAAIDADPGMQAARLDLAAVLLRTGRCAEALPFNLHLVKERPDDAVVNSAVGRTYDCLRDDEKALEYFTRAVRLDPGVYTYPQLFIAGIYERRGQPDRALEEYVDFLRRHPGAPNADAVRDAIDRLKAR